MPRKQPDLDADFDFKIFVDPSCLSAPMEEDIPQEREECAADTEEVEETETVPERAEPMDIPEDEGPEPEVRGEAEGEELEDSHLEESHIDDSHLDDSHVDDSALPEDLEPETEEQPEEEPKLSDVLDELESTLEKDIDDMLEQMHDDADDNEDGDEQQQSAEQDVTTEEDAVGEDSTAEPLDAAHEEHEEDEEKTPAVEEDVEVHEEEVVQPEHLDQDETHEESVHEDEVQPEEANEDTNEDTNEDEAHEEDSHEDEVHEAEDEHHNDIQAQVEEQVANDDGPGDEPSQEDHPNPEEETPELNNESFQDDELPLDEHPSQEDDYTEEASLLSQDSVHEDSLLEAEQDTLPPLSPRSPPHPTDRKTSLRTEALIQAAARAVVAKIEERAVAAVHSRRNSQRSNTYDNDISLLTRAASPELSRVHLSPTKWRRSRPNSPSIRPAEGDEGDSSSHHEADSDVFSDHSARSSIGSFEGHVEDEEIKTPIRDHYTPSQGRSPRVSGVSSISEISAYDKEEQFLSSPRQSRTPRMPFRTPSSVRALQMSSPTPSVFSGASPRSGKRSGGMTTSRLGSPIASTQYSPKGRSTPPRLKSRKEAPLVLLHVTLLPLRWMWGEVIDGLDSATKDGFVGGDELTSLRDAWRQLQDRVGDTVLERGILLPHPQNDYEVLEERLLEALELPLKRRARILECGHYLSAANVEDVVGDSESEDDYGYSDRRRGGGERRHWCGTCQGEIKYEGLGPRRVFRVKVYASNGLMKAGAWDACWKEMERVDVEVEPIVEAPLQRELERLSAYQVEVEERKGEEEERALRGEHEHEPPHLPVISAQDVEYDEHISSPPAMHASPPSPAQLPSSPMPLARSPTPFDNSEARRLRDEARLREIYGLPPTPLSEAHDPEPEPEPEPIPSSTYHEPTPQPEYTHPTEESYVPHTDSQQWTPDSPSEEANARRSHRRTESGSPYQSASLPELMLESVKVLLRDRKNVAIAVLSLFVLFLAVRPQSTGLDYRIQVPVEGYRFEKTLDTIEGFVKEPLKAEVKENVLEVQTAGEETIWPHVTMSVDSETVEATPSVEVVDEVATSSEVLVEATPSVEVADEVATTSEVVVEATPSIDLIGEETVHADSHPVDVPVLEASMTASVEAAPPAEMEHNETPSPAPASDIPNASSSAESEPTAEAPTTDVAPTASVTPEANDDAPSTETSSAETAPTTSAAVQEPESTEDAEPAPTSANPCESLTSTSPAEAETTVTEMKVIRVFETITETETVRVRVTTTQSYFAADATVIPAVEMVEFELGGPYRLDEEAVFEAEEV